jgi:hypothetical protein
MEPKRQDPEAKLLAIGLARMDASREGFRRKAEANTNREAKLRARVKAALEIKTRTGHEADANAFINRTREKRAASG